jgi:hypothetical protein
VRSNVRVDRAPRSEATREPSSEAAWRSGRTRGWATPRTVRAVSSPPFATHARSCALALKHAQGGAHIRGEQHTPQRRRLHSPDAPCRMGRSRHARAMDAWLAGAAIVASRCGVPPSLLWGLHVEGIGQAQRCRPLGQCHDRPALLTPAPATGRSRWRESTAGRTAHRPEQARSHLAQKYATGCEASLRREACKAKAPAGADCGGNRCGGEARRRLAPAREAGGGGQEGDGERSDATVVCADHGASGGAQIAAKD